MLLPLWVGAFAAGAAVALAWPSWAAWLALGAAACVAVALALRRAFLSALAGIALAGGVVAGWRAAALPPEAPPGALRVEGVVIRGAEPMDETGRRVRFVVRTASVPGYRSANVGVTVAGGARPPEVGDAVAFTAEVGVPWGHANPGLPDARLRAKAKGTDLVASPTGGVERTDEGSPLDPRRWAARARRALVAVTDAAVGAREAAFLRGVVLGERTAFGAEVEDGFRAAGATHVLSVSGLHLAAIAGLVFVSLRWLLALWPAIALRLAPPALAAALAIPLVAFYALLTGAAIATERSAWMATVALAAVIVRRPVSLATAVAAAAAVLLARTPLVLLDVSFQLTFASVIGLAILARRVGPAARAKGSRALRWLGGFAAATLAATVATAPLVAHHFGQVTPAALFGNLALVPLVELLVLPLGLGGAVLAWVHPLAGAIPLTVAGWGARLALWIAELFRVVAPVLVVRHPNGLETAALTLAGCFAVWGLGQPAGRRRGWVIAAGVAAIVAATSVGGRELARRISDDVHVTFLDVGQGDAIVVEGPRGFVAVVDGGGAYDGGFDPGERILEPYLRTRGIARIDLVALSHPHPDHMNGLLRVVQRFPVAALWTSGDDGRNPIYRRLVDLAVARGAQLPIPRPVEHDGLVLRPVGPFLGDEIRAPPGLSVNDASLALRAEYRGRAVLLLGDLEADGEAELVARAATGVPIAADVLKVPHHGSRTSSTIELLAAVRPTMAVAMLGRRNRFRFPHEEVVRRLEARGVPLLRTDQHGAVTVTLGENGEVHATCVRGCR